MAVRIYTRTGDTGQTGLFGGQRVSKFDPRIVATGDLDEFNASLGIARAVCTDSEFDALLASIQSELFSAGADIATPMDDSGSHGAATVTRMTAAPASHLERVIDQLEEEIPPLMRFILPGGTALAAQLHFSRTVCRRAERSLVALMQQQPANPEVLIYLNRLSDLLFVMARCANARAGKLDVPWEPSSTSIPSD
jgi:cob(I)alamin adenosyltransferase